MINVYNESGDVLSTIKYHEGFLGQRIGTISCLAFHPHLVSFDMVCLLQQVQAILICGHVFLHQFSKPFFFFYSLVHVKIFCHILDQISSGHFYY